MRVISINELRVLTGGQLLSLLTQLQAVLADLPHGAPERTFVALTLANIRTVLARPAPHLRRKKPQLAGISQKPLDFNVPVLF